MVPIIDRYAGGIEIGAARQCHENDATPVGVGEKLETVTRGSARRATPGCRT